MRKIITNKKFALIMLVLIVLFAAILRLWQLDSVPISPDWDEAALGYNAYSIMLTGKDEHGKFMPIVLQSFGDYKPALYTYLIIPFIRLLDLNVFAIRLPSAIAGIFAVLLTYFLVKELFNLSKTKKNNISNVGGGIALTAALLLAISPWSIQFSRVAFEANVAMVFNLAGVLFFLKGLKKPLFFSLTAVFFVLSLLTYQSEKLFVPLLGLILLGVFWKQVFALPKKYLAIAVVLFGFLSFPLMCFTFTDAHGLARAKGVSFFSNQTAVLQHTMDKLDRDRANNDMLGLLLDNRRIVLAKAVVAGYLTHFDLNWLFITGDLEGRHHSPFMGLLYLFELPFLLIGIYLLIFGKFLDKRAKLVLLLWFLASPIPASIAPDVPHSVRTLNFLPTFQIFTAIGLVMTFKFIQKQRFKFLFIGIFLLIASFNIVYYLNQYFVQQNYYTAKDWRYGYKELVAYVNPLQGKYNKIIVSDQNTFDQSYIFFLFYLKYNPQKYLAEGSSRKHFANFEFRPFNYTTEKEASALFIGAPVQFPPATATRTIIKYPDGSDAMMVVEKK